MRSAQRGHGLDTAYTCLPQGMPRMMSGVSPFEFLILPNVTYMLFERTDFSPRRIYTEPMRPGSRDTRSGNGSIPTTTAATTRSSSRPAACAGHTCGTIIKERISIAKSEPGMLRVEMTAIDNSLTRPWTVLKTFKPVRQRQK